MCCGGAPNEQPKYRQNHTIPELHKPRSLDQNPCVGAWRSVRGLEPWAWLAQLVPLSVTGAPATLSSPEFILQHALGGTPGMKSWKPILGHRLHSGLRVKLANGYNMGDAAAWKGTPWGPTNPPHQAQAPLSPVLGEAWVRPGRTVDAA